MDIAFRVGGGGGGGEENFWEISRNKKIGGGILAADLPWNGTDLPSREVKIWAAAAIKPLPEFSIINTSSSERGGGEIPVSTLPEFSSILT